MADGAERQILAHVVAHDFYCGLVQADEVSILGTARQNDAIERLASGVNGSGVNGNFRTLLAGNGAGLWGEDTHGSAGVLHGLQRGGQLGVFEAIGSDDGNGLVI